MAMVIAKVKLSIVCSVNNPFRKLKFSCELQSIFYWEMIQTEMRYRCPPVVKINFNLFN